MFKKFKKLSKSKSIILSTLVICLLVGTIGVTLAWLTSKTDLINNTFTYGDIKISLIESDTNDDDDDVNTNSYEIMPGTTINKDTKVIVKGKSEDCWLFIKIEEENDFSKFMTYSLEDNWTKLDVENGVFYIEVNKKNLDQEFYVIKDNIISIKEEITNNDVEQIDRNNYPKLIISAYAVQRDEDMDAISTPEKAWELANSKSN